LTKIPIFDKNSDFFGKVVRLGVKEFRGLQNDLTNIWQKFNPWPHIICPAQKNFGATENMSTKKLDL